MSDSFNKVQAHGVTSKNSPAAPMTVEIREPRAGDVQLDVMWSGMCHSDVHQARDEWGGSIFPMVPGHEIIGRVTKVGGDVKKHKVGDIVAIGCMRSSCLHCKTCKHDEEQYCKALKWTYNSKGADGVINHGGYARSMVVEQHFVFNVPAGLHKNLAGAAPLLCAGITTFSPLYRHNVKVGSRVGVVGLGGLGHMAVKFGVAMGAVVTVISSTAAKQADALKLGAHRFLLSSDRDALKAAADSFDVIINTLSVKFDMSTYLSLLDIGGTMILVGVPPASELGAHSLIGGRKMVAGSLVGGVAETQTMLELCADKGIFSEVEIVKAADINAAWDRMVKADVRYRFVIDGSTLGH